MKKRIEKIHLKEGISRYEMLKRVKTMLNSSLSEASDFCKNLKQSYYYEIEEDLIPKLREAFDFKIEPETNRAERVWREREIDEAEDKSEAAEKWLATLTDEQKEYVRYLTKLHPAMG